MCLLCSDQCSFLGSHLFALSGAILLADPSALLICDVVMFSRAPVTGCQWKAKGLVTGAAMATVLAATAVDGFSPATTQDCFPMLVSAPPYFYSSLLRLPEDVLLLVLSYLKRPELCCSFATTSKACKRLAYRPQLWQSLVIPLTVCV